jgi:hypothetical protein
MRSPGQLSVSERLRLRTSCTRASALGKNANCQSLVSLTLGRGEVPVMVALRRDDLGISCAMLAWAARHPHLEHWVGYVHTSLHCSAISTSPRLTACWSGRKRLPSAASNLRLGGLYMTQRATTFAASEICIAGCGSARAASPTIVSIAALHLLQAVRLIAFSSS